MTTQPTPTLGQTVEVWAGVFSQRHPSPKPSDPWLRCEVLEILPSMPSAALGVPPTNLRVKHRSLTPMTVPFPSTVVRIPAP